jgi:hypothetical protein
MNNINEPHADRESLRTGGITAVSIFLGFSLAFGRYWSFGGGQWNKLHIIPAFFLFSGMATLIYSLFIALDPNDSSVKHFTKFRIILISGIICLIVGLLSAIIVASMLS